MKAKVTSKGVLIPKSLLEGIDEVDILKQDGMIIVVAAREEDPIFQLGRDPIEGGVPDASENHDYYLYDGK